MEGRPRLQKKLLSGWNPPPLWDWGPFQLKRPGCEADQEGDQERRKRLLDTGRRGMAGGIHHIYARTHAHALTPTHIHTRAQTADADQIPL